MKEGGEIFKTTKMHERTKEINRAIAKAKKRDNYRCLLCGRGESTGDSVDGAHIASRNGSHGIDPRDAGLILTLCREHHIQYDSLSLMVTRRAWLERRGLEMFSVRLQAALKSGMRPPTA